MSNQDRIENVSTFPIDIVYTWVNHEDINWKTLYSQVRNADNDKHKSATDSARFQNRNELYYSILSVHKYAPWVNRIFVVSNCDLPAYIAELDKVEFVHHKLIFENPNDLPTFNSHAIESNLHRINGLSENFIYFNDDFFLVKYTDQRLFFPSAGRINIFPSRHKIPYHQKGDLKAVDSAAIYTGNLLRKSLSFSPEYKLHHAPYPILRSIMCEIQDLYPIEARKTSGHKFRHPNDVPFATTFHAYYCKAKGIGECVDVRSRYVDINHPLFFLLTNRFSPLRKGKYQFLCLNDTSSTKIFPRVRDMYLECLLNDLFL